MDEAVARRKPIEDNTPSAIPSGINHGFTAAALRSGTTFLPSKHIPMPYLELAWQAISVCLTPLNLLGAAGVAIGCTWPLFKTRTTILTVQAAGSLCFALHYVLLGSLTGAAMCTVSITQGMASARLHSRLLLTLVYAVTASFVLVATWSTWHGWPSLFAALGSTCGMAGRLQRDPLRMRLAFLCGTFAWMGHNVLMQSAFGLTADLLSLSASCIGLWRCFQSAAVPGGNAAARPISPWKWLHIRPCQPASSCC